MIDDEKVLLLSENLLKTPLQILQEYAVRFQKNFTLQEKVFENDQDRKFRVSIQLEDHELVVKRKVFLPSSFLTITTSGFW